MSKRLNLTLFPTVFSVEQIQELSGQRWVGRKREGTLVTGLVTLLLCIRYAFSDIFCLRFQMHLTVVALFLCAVGLEVTQWFVILGVVVFHSL